MALPSSSRPKFEADGVPAPAPSGSSAQPSLGALVRFEFEAGRGNEGTKILMVEWEEDESSTTSSGDWEVSWEGKTTLLSARDGAEDRLHRIYFLLGPGTSIPPVVRLSRKGGADGSALDVKPLPAIFPAELGLRGTAAGRRGILHTRYAKQRLAALHEEIEREMRTNGEGIGLEIAVQERQWLVENFGVTPLSRFATDVYHSASASLGSPKTPGGGRLAERLKGLKLGTSASELSGSSGDQDHSKSTTTSSSHPLSPDTGDLAVSSFSIFHGAAPAAPRRAVAQDPPGSLLAQQRAGAGNRIASLDELTSADPEPAPRKQDDDETEDELFAVKLSPRSPDMTKSPFSFAAKESVAAVAAAVAAQKEHGS